MYVLNAINPFCFERLNVNCVKITLLADRSTACSTIQLYCISTWFCCASFDWTSGRHYCLVTEDKLDLSLNYLYAFLLESQQ